MIDGKLKQKLLDEIKKFGNVYLSCLKVGIDKSTYYRWKKKNKQFKQKADEAEKLGRENISDVAEHALLQNVRKLDQRAIEYTLNHNSKKYKQKPPTNVVFVHRKESPISNIQPKTLEDLIDDDQINRDKHINELYIKFTEHGKTIPPKPDGSPIELYELIDYEAYINNWQESQGKVREALKSKTETTPSQSNA